MKATLIEGCPNTEDVYTDKVFCSCGGVCEQRDTTLTNNLAYQCLQCGNTYSESQIKTREHDTEECEFCQ